MRSFPAMQDMARTPAEKASDTMGLITPCVSDLPDYDYGLSVSFNDESLEKLNMESDVHVGDYVHIHAFAKVTCVHQKPGSDKPDRVDLVLTHVAAEEEDDEREDDDE